eukprot:g267.t1
MGYEYCNVDGDPASYNNCVWPTQTECEAKTGNCSSGPVPRNKWRSECTDQDPDTCGQKSGACWACDFNGNQCIGHWAGTNCGDCDSGYTKSDGNCLPSSAGLSSAEVALIVMAALIACAALVFVARRWLARARKTRRSRQTVGYLSSASTNVLGHDGAGRDFGYAELPDDGAPAGLVGGTAPVGGSPRAGMALVTNAKGLRLTELSDGGGADDGERVVFLDSDPSTGAVSASFSAAEIAAATDNFSEARLLGRGGFGEVYRGDFPRIGESTAAGGPAAATVPVAIKVLRAGQVLRSDPASKHSAIAQLRQEAAVLGKYRHPNIVALLGYCVAADDPQTRPCLVFEFMPGGSLRARLARGPRGAATGGGAAGEPWWLPCEDRFVVAADVARGLAFLHTATDPPIIHQDVKSDNILLAQGTGGTTRAKIADFGTARLYDPRRRRDRVMRGWPGGMTGTATAPTHASTAHVIGSYGYMPVEYCMQGHVSVKTDAFALGVVLLELLTGRPPLLPGGEEMLAEELAEDLAGPEPPRVRMHLDPKAGTWRDERSAVALAALAERCLRSVSARCTAAEIRPKLDRLAAHAVAERTIDMH